MDFEWDARKARENLQNHKVSFEEAEQAFDDPFGIEYADEFHSDYEIRYRLIALSPRRLLFVVYTYADENTVRLISARKAAKIERELYNNAKR
ncbi:MAG: BrnT family toxin [Pyrinomonadaceae bacterium]